MKSILTFLAAGLGLILAPVLAGAVTHTVNQSGLTFVPADITIEIGDTVEWIWESGNHTVTSGTDLSDPEVGVLFDAPLNSGNPSFSFTFNEVGVQDYFCRPHLNFGMVGSVTVTSASPVDQTPRTAALNLQANVPNPFNPSTRITFDLADTGQGSTRVSLRVFDLQGRLVKVLLEESMATDRHTAVWDGRNDQGAAVPSGVYVYRLSAAGKTLARTMTLAK